MKKFKKDDYIVCKVKTGTGYLFYHVYKIARMFDNYLFNTYLDSVGSKRNGWNTDKFRLATKEEGEMYEDAGRPVDVTTYKMKEVVLPELWCVKITEDNIEELGNWRTDGELDDIQGYCNNIYNDKVGYNASTIYAGYKEITTEQFIKYVLKTTPTQQHNFKVGDIVEFINKNSENAKYFKKGLKNLEIKSVPPKKGNLPTYVYESDKSIYWAVRLDEIRLMQPNSSKDDTVDKDWLREQKIKLRHLNETFESHKIFIFDGSFPNTQHMFKELKVKVRTKRIRIKL